MRHACDHCMYTVCTAGSLDCRTLAQLWSAAGVFYQTIRFLVSNALSWHGEGIL